MSHPDIYPLTPANIAFKPEDLQAFLAQPDDQSEPIEPFTIADLAPSLEIESRRLQVPDHPGLAMQWVDLEKLSGPAAPETSRACTPDSAGEHVNTYEAELSRLATAGVVIPPHVSYLVDDNSGANRPARIYTAALRPATERHYRLMDAIVPHTNGYNDQLSQLRSIFEYHASRSLFPWRAAAAQHITSYRKSERGQAQLINLVPALIEPRFAETTALNSLVEAVGLMPHTEASLQLLEELHQRRETLGQE